MREFEMINSFQEFRKKWEKYAKDNNKTPILASDNPVFDGGFINQLIFKYLSNVMPIPYSASEQEYSAFFDTHNEQRGLLFSVDP